ncbi:MAG: DUF975 family protein [Clostridiales bacterium]|nr:DUF975 family protein [Clostridiales bacterium]
MSEKENKKALPGNVTWSIKQIWTDAFNTVYKRGFKAYVMLFLVFFVFSFLGIVHRAASGEIDIIDSRFGAGKVNAEDIELLQDYSLTLPLIRDLPDDIKNTLVRDTVGEIALSRSWFINLLAVNHHYVERNLGEVLAFTAIIVALGYCLASFVSRGLAIGQYRYLMECRFSDDVKIKRIFAPFGKGRMRHILFTMIIYGAVMLLWQITIIGGVIKGYEYAFVPYLIAENPDIKWREAKRLSSAMTKGYKFRMFLVDLSQLPLIILGIIPFIELPLITPVTAMLPVNIYLTLRGRDDIDRSLFIEKGFDGAGDFVMPDLQIKGSSFDKADKYKVTDFIIMFYTFCLVGWIWEVSYHLVKDHLFFNRGFLYGPWLPIYGFGGVFIIFFLNRFKDNKPKLFVSAMILCGILEYLTSFILEFFYNASYWDYKTMFINLNGRVCIAGLLAFALGGFLGVYLLGPMIRRCLDHIGPKKTKVLCIALTALFVADIICVLVFGPNGGEGVGQKLEAAVRLSRFL